MSANNKINNDLNNQKNNTETTEVKNSTTDCDSSTNLNNSSPCSEKEKINDKNSKNFVNSTDVNPPLYQTEQPFSTQTNNTQNNNFQYVYPENYTRPIKKDYTTLFSVLCYIPLLWLIGLLLDLENPIVKFHINQGIALNIFSFGLNIIIAAITSVLLFLFPASVFITTLLSILSGLATFIFMILGIINAIKKELKPLPLIGKIFTFVD